MLSRKEKEELVELAHSVSFREDMRKVAQGRHDPFFVNGKLDIDKFLIFLTEFNQFINHEMRPFKPIIDEEMRL